jgi:hypothetical protein
MSEFAREELPAPSWGKTPNPPLKGVAIVGASKRRFLA